MSKLNLSVAIGDQPWHGAGKDTDFVELQRGGRRLVRRLAIADRLEISDKITPVRL